MFGGETMLFFNEELFNNKEQLNLFMAKIQENIKFNIKILSMHKSILLNYVLKIVDEPILENSIDNAEQTIDFLTKLQYFLGLVDQNMECVEFLQSNYNKLKIPFELSELQEYYNIYNEKISEINSSQLELNNFFAETSKILSYKIPNKENKEHKENTEPKENKENKEHKENTKQKEQKIAEEPPALTNTDSNNSIENNDLSYPENTLIISEISKTVLLPYKKSELDNLEDVSVNKNDLIRKKYVVPIEKYKSPALSRFREAFKLMRNIEKKSMIEAIDLGIELSLNSKLHPAIISACRSLDELDIYLDYLDSNQTDKFNCFSIKFEIAPLLK